jgi:hypothetical protein
MSNSIVNSAAGNPKCYSLQIDGIYKGLPAYAWCVAFNAKEAERILAASFQSMNPSDLPNGAETKVHGQSTTKVLCESLPSEYGKSGIIWDGEY